MRLWNEGATIILFAVVFLVILKNAFNWIYGVVGIVVFSILIMLGFRFYKRIRDKTFNNCRQSFYWFIKLYSLFFNVNECIISN